MSSRLDKTTLKTFFQTGDHPNQTDFSNFIDTTLTPEIVSVGNVSGTVNTDASTGDLFRMTLTGAIVLSAPTNGVDGQAITFWLQQDGAGNHTIDITAFTAPSSATLPLPFSTAGNKMDMFVARYDGANVRWLIVSMVPGY